MIFLFQSTKSGACFVKQLHSINVLMGIGYEVVQPVLITFLMLQLLAETAIQKWSKRLPVQYVVYEYLVLVKKKVSEVLILIPNPTIDHVVNKIYSKEIQ